MKKKALSLVLAAMMVTGLVACGEKTPAASASGGDSAGDAKVTIKLGYTHGTSNPQESDEVMYAQTFK